MPVNAIPVQIYNPKIFWQSETLEKECLFTNSATNYLLIVRTVRLNGRVDLAVCSIYLIGTGRVDKVRITNYTSMVSNGLITTTTTLRI